MWNFTCKIWFLEKFGPPENGLDFKGPIFFGNCNDSKSVFRVYPGPGLIKERKPTIHNWKKNESKTSHLIHTKRLQKIFNRGNGNGNQQFGKIRMGKSALYSSVRIVSFRSSLLRTYVKYAFVNLFSLFSKSDKCNALFKDFENIVCVPLCGCLCMLSQKWKNKWRNNVMIDVFVYAYYMMD